MTSTKAFILIEPLVSEVAEPPPTPTDLVDDEHKGVEYEAALDESRLLAPGRGQHRHHQPCEHAH